MTQVSIEYQVNPRFVPGDIPLWLGNAKDSAIIYDATAGELTLQTQNAAAVLTDRIRVESGTGTPFVEFAAGRLRLLDAAADPAAAGEMTRNGADVKVYSGGGVRDLSAMGTLNNIVEDTTPQLGGDLASNGNGILLADNDKLLFGDVTAESSLYFDGTDTIFNLRENGSGDLMIALAGSFPSPDPDAVHIWKGTAGTVVADSESLLILEGSANTFINLLTPNDVTSGIRFGDPENSKAGEISYVHSANRMTFRIGGSTRLNYTDGAFAFAQATTISTSVGDLTLNPADDVDLSSNSLLNVGAAGNDWTQNALTLAGGALGQEISITTTGQDTSSTLTVAIPADGGSATGPATVRWHQGDASGDANNMAYSIQYQPNNAYLTLASADSDGSSTAADIWRILDGQTTIDANTTWDINVFDDYDDAMVLSPYRHGVMNLAQRKRELVQMGVLREYEDGWTGYNDQRMAALLAGGIYQTRQRLDQFHTDHERRIRELETGNLRLKEMINA